MNEADLMALLDKQNHIASRAQLLAIGVRDSAMTRHVRRGDWQRVVPGVYALEGSTLSVEQRRTVSWSCNGRCTWTAVRAMVDCTN